MLAMAFVNMDILIAQLIVAPSESRSLAIWGIVGVNEPPTNKGTNPAHETMDTIILFFHGENLS